MVVGIEAMEKKFPKGRPYIVANPQLLHLPVFAQGGPPGENPVNEEELISIKPDLIFATYLTHKAADRLQNKTGIPVFVLNYGELATFENKALFSSLMKAGKILGKEKRALEVIKYIKKVEKNIAKRVMGIPGKEKHAVYVGGLGHKGFHGIDSTMAKFPPFEMLKLKSPVDRVKMRGWIAIDREKLLEWDPDYIFIDEGGLPLIMQDYSRAPSFYRSLSAVRKGRVYGLLPFNFYTTNIEVALANAYFIGKVIYPDRFKDISPEKKADEIFEFFVGRAVYSAMKKDYGGYIRIKFPK